MGSGELLPKPKSSSRVREVRGWVVGCVTWRPCERQAPLSRGWRAARSRRAAASALRKGARRLRWLGRWLQGSELGSLWNGIFRHTPMAPQAEGQGAENKADMLPSLQQFPGSRCSEVDKSVVVCEAGIHCDYHFFSWLPNRTFDFARFVCSASFIGWLVRPTPRGQANGYGKWSTSDANSADTGTTTGLCQTPCVMHKGI
jgi:hypothetical protein